MATGRPARCGGPGHGRPLEHLRGPRAAEVSAPGDDHAVAFGDRGQGSRQGRERLRTSGPASSAGRSIPRPGAPRVRPGRRNPRTSASASHERPISAAVRGGSEDITVHSTATSALFRGFDQSPQHRLVADVIRRTATDVAHGDQPKWRRSRASAVLAHSPRTRSAMRRAAGHRTVRRLECTGTHVQRG